MKYFYTDPLEAAYMAKHYGMRFQEDKGDKFYNYHQDWTSFPTTRASCLLYIHPDSLAILEPQDGDLVMVDDLDVGTCVVLHGNPMVRASKFRRILDRNDKVFFWPEVENG